jgi:hypothetical protein
MCCASAAAWGNAVLFSIARAMREAGNHVLYFAGYKNQKHRDPVTGQETVVFTCFNQGQDMDRGDFVNLAARLRQNTVQEKLSNLWLDHLLSVGTLAHV